jgi:hypothetical protein
MFIYSFVVLFLFPFVFMLSEKKKKKTDKILVAGIRRVSRILENFINQFLFLLTTMLLI